LDAKESCRKEKRKRRKASTASSRLDYERHHPSIISVTLTKVLVNVTRRKEVDEGNLERLDIEDGGNADVGSLRVVRLVGGRRKVEAGVLVG
jgi:hypothetical protein